MKKISIVYYLMGNRLFTLFCLCCNLVCAFAAVFSEKSAILSAKVAKSSFLAFLSVFFGTSIRALGTNQSSCKNVWESAQDI